MKLKLRKISSSAVDESEIDRYRFSYIAVRLVLWYNESLLDPVKKIGDLPSGAYGVFNTAENERILPDGVKESIGLSEDAPDSWSATIPETTLKQYFPNINIVANNTIRINISRIMSEQSDDWSIVSEIASTIVHEATHVREWESYGFTSEGGPEMAEKMFLSWVGIHRDEILNSYPDIAPQTEGFDNQVVMTDANGQDPNFNIYNTDVR